MYNHLYNIFKHWSHPDDRDRPRGSVYIYSDPHFADAEMSQLRKNYIGDDEQVKKINTKIGKYDTIIFLGDIGNLEFIKKIKGYKILIMGNHDSGETNYQRQTEILYYPLPECDITNAFIVADTIKRDFVSRNLSREYRINNYAFIKKDGLWQYEVIYDNHLFDEVYPGFLTISEKVILSHEPVEVPGMFNIHGHTHDLKIKKIKDAKTQEERSVLENIDEVHYCVCAEFIDYTPIRLIQVIESGKVNKISSVHRLTIDKATLRKRHKNSKLAVI